MEPGQNLPLGPVDGRHAVRRRLPAHVRRSLRLHLPLVLGVVGLALAGAGAWLGVSPTSVAVSQDADAYVVDGVRLPAAEGAPGTYAGPGGAMVVREDGGVVRAAASTALDGRHMTGRCVWRRGAPEETCTFTLEQRSLAATDVRTAWGWRRQYDDGEAVDLETSGGGTVLVPFAVGLRT